MGIDYIFGTASFEDSKTVKVNDKLYKGKHILIASGSYADNGKFEGSDLCITSDDVFKFEELPESLVVLGGGYIGVEMAQIMQGFGVKTTLIVRDKILKVVDQEVIGLLKESMTKLGLNLVMGEQFSKVVATADNKLEVHCNSGNKFVGSKVLVALGRPSNLGSLNLEKAGVALKKDGYIEADEF